jgi:putative SOS response-associated peptidase YedK
MIPIQFAWSPHWRPHRSSSGCTYLYAGPFWVLWLAIKRGVPPVPGVFPDYPAPVVRNAATSTRDGDDALGHVSVNGLVVLPQNIRNTSSPHWRGWLKPESRCSAPANSFAEYAPDPNPATKKDVV